jgi:hypothetical protein
MRIIVVLLLIAHGLIHILGFFKAFNLAQIDQLTQGISKVQGVLWLLTTVIYVVAGFLFLLKNGLWWLPSILAILLSQYLIISSWQDAKFGTVANIILLLVTIIGFSSWSFNSKYEKDVIDNLKSSVSSEEILTASDLSGLPDAVQRYLKYTGIVGKPKVHNFKVAFSGRIRQNEQSDWMEFTAEQHSFLETPTRLFFMDATMKHLPVAGYHRYEDGEAYMDIRLLSLIPVQYQTGEKMGIAETVTFFNDMCLMAPATLIDERIQWLETEGNKVKASFTTNSITITAWLHFNEEGALVNFVSEDRYALMDDGSMQQFPWLTPVRDYQEIKGYRLLESGDAVFEYPEGEMVYGTFELKDVQYNVKEFND